MPRNPGQTTHPAICVRATREWLGWLNDYAQSRYRSTSPQLIDLALAKLAAADDYPAPPARLEP